MNLSFLRNHNTQLVLVSAASLAVGGYVSYAYTNKHAEVKYSQIAEREIQEAKHFYSKLSEKAPTPGEQLAILHPEIVDQSEAMDAAVVAITDYTNAAVTGETEVTLETIREAVTVRNNIFEDQGRNDDIYVLQVLENRDTSKPYILTEEEWQAGEPGYDQITLTYWAGDNVLMDDKDEVVNDINGVIGAANLEHFGFATGDENTMFIRNDKFQSDYEVVRSDGKYTHEVLGLQHSDEDYRPSVRKFRDRD